MTKIDLRSFSPEVFRVFSQQPPLLTAGDRQELNTMTIGWCQLGEVWHMPICTVFVRPERYTYSFMESHDYFTVSVFDPSWKAMINDCGRRSGRDVDKVKAHNLTVCYGEGDAPYFAQAEWALVCKKMYFTDLNPTRMLDERLKGFYQTDGLHRIYMGEVRELYQKDN